ncbi:MAG: hypothetical protein J0L58_13450 [Burkholderiales bacterium]|uniref:hypothetical protein n=1 Tax=Inhella sp. TaxID=1921806 RepID=UPI001ACD09C4|nr:hypothetical protein [Burkholderiales bacterium]
MPAHRAPAVPAHLEAAVLHCRRLVRKRALLAAGVAAVPVPGLDWATDVGILLKLIPQINLAFGLTEAQIERLAPERKAVVLKAVSAGGSLLIGKLITRELVIKALTMVGIRLSTQQAAKFVPVAGQAVSALLTYSALKWVCEQHIRQCLAVAQQAQLPAPSAGA